MTAIYIYALLGFAAVCGFVRLAWIMAREEQDDIDWEDAARDGDLKRLGDE